MLGVRRACALLPGSWSSPCPSPSLSTTSKICCKRRRGGGASSSRPTQQSAIRQGDTRGHLNQNSQRRGQRTPKLKVLLTWCGKGAWPIPCSRAHGIGGCGSALKATLQGGVWVGTQSYLTRRCVGRHPALRHPTAMTSLPSNITLNGHGR